jgi:hypothetical protein
LAHLTKRHDLVGRGAKKTPPQVMGNMTIRFCLSSTVLGVKKLKDQGVQVTKIRYDSNDPEEINDMAFRFGSPARRKIPKYKMRSVIKEDTAR